MSSNQSKPPAKSVTWPTLKPYTEHPLDEADQQLLTSVNSALEAEGRRRQKMAQDEEAERLAKGQRFMERMRQAGELARNRRS